MKRAPNPWIAVPSLLVGALAAFLGWMVTDVSCRSGGGDACPGWGLALAAVSFLAATIGVGLVLVLAYRSLAEWRERSESDVGDDQ